MIWGSEKIFWYRHEESRRWFKSKQSHRTNGSIELYDLHVVAFEEYYRVTYSWFAGNSLLVRLWKWYFQQSDGPSNLFDTWPALLRVIVQLKLSRLSICFFLPSLFSHSFRNFIVVFCNIKPWHWRVTTPSATWRQRDSASYHEREFPSQNKLA